MDSNDDPTKTATGNVCPVGNFFSLGSDNFGVICRLLDRDEEAAHGFELALDKSPSYANVIHQLESIQ